jgi:hypothetical protein
LQGLQRVFMEVVNPFAFQGDIDFFTASWVLSSNAARTGSPISRIGYVH